MWPLALIFGPSTMVVLVGAWKRWSPSQRAARAASIQAHHTLVEALRKLEEEVPVKLSLADAQLAVDQFIKEHEHALSDHAVGVARWTLKDIESGYSVDRPGLILEHEKMTDWGQSGWQYWQPVLGGAALLASLIGVGTVLTFVWLQGRQEQAWCADASNHPLIYNAAYELEIEINPLASSRWEDGLLVYDPPEDIVVLALNNPILGDPYLATTDFGPACREAWYQRDTDLYAGTLAIPDQGTPLPPPPDFHIEDRATQVYLSWATEKLSDTVFADAPAHGTIAVAEQTCNALRDGNSVDQVSLQLFNTAMLDAPDFDQANSYVLVFLIGGVDTFCPEQNPQVAEWLASPP